jgi:predicted Zn-dependent protease
MNARIHSLSAAVIIAALFLTSGCLRREDYVPIDKKSLKGSGKLYFVPLGIFPAKTANDLASFYRNKYGFQAEILPNVPYSSTAIDPRRNQLIAERAIEMMKEANPQLANDSQAILIGLTTKDMYIAKYDWQFSFSFRAEGKYGVVSSGRMTLPGRQGITEELIRTRFRKMLTKNIGMLYYHLPASNDPRSVLYRNVGGISELDYMGEEF